MTAVGQNRDACGKLRRIYPFPERRPQIPPRVLGWNTPLNLEVFARLVAPDASVVVELGCWLGQSTLELLKKAVSADVICIDHWQGSAEHRAHRLFPKLLPTLYDRFLANVWEHRERVIPVKETTTVGIRLLADHDIKPDFIYVDASHEYEDVRGDIELSLSMFPNAVLCGDDYNWPGVRNAIADIGLEPKIENNGRCWWLPPLQASILSVDLTVPPPG
jgi:hypothetical protein